MPQWRLPERIDIAKGPNALLFGTSEPGGVANFNTKRANFTDRTAVAFRVGSWDQYRATLDVNRQLSPNWAARINLVEDSRKNWENWVGSERGPSIWLSPTASAKTPRCAPSKIPRSFRAAHNSPGRTRIRSPIFTHSAVLNLVRTNNPTTANFNNANNTIRRRVYFAASDTAQNSALGVPASDSTSGIATAFMPTGGKTRLWSEATYEGISAAGTYWEGLLRTSVGLRRDENSNDIQSGARNATSGLMDFTDPRRNVNQLKKYSPTVGGTLRPFGPITVFFNYAKTFRAPGTTGTNPLGESTTLRQGEGREGGVRLELLEGRFYLTTSAYDITQTGQNHSVAAVATAINGIWNDPILNSLNPTYADKVLTGGTSESQTLHATGYEIELSANLTPAWTLTAGYGNNINRVGETEVGTLGYVHANLPEWERLAAANPLLAASINAEIAAVHDYLLEAVPGLVRGRSYRDTVNLFTRYNFREGRLKGVTIGGGMSYRSPAALNSQMNSGVVTTLWGSIITEYEAMAAYSFRFSAKVRGRLQLNIRNLLDRRRYEEVNLSQTRYEAPRSLSLTTTLSF